MTNPLITAARAAKRCGVPSAWLKAEAEAGRVPCLQTGTDKFLFDPEALIAALQDRARQPPARREVAACV